MAQAAIKPQELSVEVCNQEKHTPHGRQKHLSFVVAGQLVEDSLRRYGFTGSFKMYPRDPLVGTPELQRRGLIFTRLNDNPSQGILIKIQPSDNKTAWSYNLVPPRGFSAEEFWKQIQEAIAFTKEGFKDGGTPSNDAAAADSIPLEPEVVQAEAFTPEMFLNDDTLVSVFVTENSSDIRCMSFSDYMECFREIPGCDHWTILQRQQAIQGMVNRKYLIELVGKKDTLAPCEKRFPQFKRVIAPAKVAEAPKSKPPMPAPQIVVVSPPQPPKRVDTRLREAAPAPQLVLAEKSASTPVGGNLIETIQILETRAVKFAEAQQAGVSDDKRRASLVIKLDQARIMVTTLESEIQAIDESRAQNLQVLMNSEYSDAATQLARIKDMLGIS